MLSDTPKYHALGHPSVKLQFMMSSLRGNMIICPRPIFEWGCNLSHFGLFVLGSTRFLQSFLGYGSKSKTSAFVLGCTGHLQRNKLRADKSW